MGTTGIRLATCSASETASRAALSGTLTTSEAAALLNVSVATLKRWTEAGLVTSERTTGGHRRFRRADVEALTTRRGAGEPAATLVDRLLALESGMEVLAFLLKSRRSLGSWWAVVDALGGVALELARRRADAELSLLASESVCDRLRLALGWALESASSGPVAPVAPVLLLAAAPEDRLLLAGPALTLGADESGWVVRHAGRATPEELGRELAREAPAAVLIATSEVDAGGLGGHAASVHEATLATRTPLAFVGAAGWADAPAGTARLGSLPEVRGWLAELEPTRSPPEPRGVA